LYTKSYITS